MALFRQHRGGLAESLESTIIVKNKQELLEHLLLVVNSWLIPEAPRSALYHIPTIRITSHNRLDPRCGWYSELVTADMLIKDEFIPMGFLSEPLDG